MCTHICTRRFHDRTDMDESVCLKKELAFRGKYRNAYVGVGGKSQFPWKQGGVLLTLTGSEHTATNTATKNISFVT